MPQWLRTEICQAAVGTMQGFSRNDTPGQYEWSLAILQGYFPDDAALPGCQPEQAGLLDKWPLP